MVKVRDSSESWAIDELEGLMWNVHVGSKWPEVREVINAEMDKGRLEVIVLNEVRNLWDELDNWAEKNDYWIRHEKPLPDNNRVMKPQHGSTALLLDKRRPDLVLKGGKREPMTKQFKVWSHDQWHAPRRYERMFFDTKSGPWKVQADHFPTLGFSGPNKAAFMESARKTLKFLRKGRENGVASLAIGDKNAWGPDLREWFGERLRYVLVKSHSVDAIVAVGVFNILLDVLPKGPSDHHPVRFTVKRRYTIKEK